MRTVTDANVMSKASDNEPYSMLGAGNLTASLWKSGDESSGWHYRFNIFRMSRLSGRVTQRFSPRDVGDLARLAHLLAFTLSNDGCLDAELRDDLSCLAACLDCVFTLPPPRNNRQMTLTGPAATSLGTVLEYLWEDESQHFAANPSGDHIYRHLVVLRAWMAGTGPSDGSPLAEFDCGRSGEFAAVCPICGRTDGVLHGKGERWFVCHTHRLRWCVGQKRLSAGLQDAAEHSQNNWEKIRQYTEVQPFRPESSGASG